MRVLIIEDHKSTAALMKSMFKSKGINAYTTDRGDEGIDLAKIYDYDVITLDLNLPDMSGYEVLRTIRAAKVKTPVIIVSGLNDVQDKIKGLELGADDYITKPFHKDELIARVHAVVRRFHGHIGSKIEISDELCVDLNKKNVLMNNSILGLSPKEYLMMELLALKKSTTITKEMFLNHLYSGMDEPSPKIIDVFICRLRKKLRTASTRGVDYIQTIKGIGYVLNTFALAQGEKIDIPDRIRTIPSNLDKNPTQAVFKGNEATLLVYIFGNTRIQPTAKYLKIGNTQIQPESICVSSWYFLSHMLENPAQKINAASFNKALIQKNIITRPLDTQALRNSLDTIGRVLKEHDSDLRIACFADGTFSLQPQNIDQHPNLRHIFGENSKPRVEPPHTAPTPSAPRRLAGLKL